MMILAGLLSVHFLADFVCQTDKMAVNKSKSWRALGRHVLVYSACFIGWGWQFVLLTGLLHFVVDAITSRITSKLFFFKPIVTGCDLCYPDNPPAEPKHCWEPIPAARHWFFVMIGLDQLIHVWCLALTYKLIYG